MRGSSCVLIHPSLQNVSRQWWFNDGAEAGGKNGNRRTNRRGIGRRVGRSILVQGRCVDAIRRKDSWVSNNYRPREAIGGVAVIDDTDLHGLPAGERPRSDGIDLIVLHVQKRSGRAVEGYDDVGQLL